MRLSSLDYFCDFHISHEYGNGYGCGSDGYGFITGHGYGSPYGPIYGDGYGDGNFYGNCLGDGHGNGFGYI